LDEEPGVAPTLRHVRCRRQYPHVPGSDRGSHLGESETTVEDMDSTNALGEFLRARRELVRPEDAGIVRGGLRRVPGLRREEVAMLAGISSDYYLRLEQGRDRNPSVQVLDALARV
jgi:hypothetical protein